MLLRVLFAIADDVVGVVVVAGATSGIVNKLNVECCCCWRIAAAAVDDDVAAIEFFSIGFR